MHHESEVFEELTSLARNQHELNLVEKYVRGEKLRQWLLTTKEGQAISDRIEYMYCRALDDFSTSDLNDTPTLEKAKLDLTVAKRIYEIFDTVFLEAQQAENNLSGEE